MVRKQFIKDKINYKNVKRYMAGIAMCLVLGSYGGTAYARSYEESQYRYIEADDYAPAQYGLVDIESGVLSELEYNEYKEFEKVEKAYRTLVDKYYEQGLKLDISIEEFEELYYANELQNIDQYIAVDKNITAQVMTYSVRSSSNDWEYYYNTGTSRPSECNYSKYDLLSILQKGDYIYEDGVTGHSAIVEGKFYDASSKKYYIRIIEANPGLGVTRGIYDDTRHDKEDGFLRRPCGVTSTQKTKAVAFAVSQLGKGYYLDLAKDTSASEKDWYCSELVWAAYKNQGFDLETEGVSEPGVTPRDITFYTKSIALSVYK